MRIKAGQQMFWHNSESLCALGNITGTGFFGVDENKQFAAIFFDFIEKQLGIPQDRYIYFYINCIYYIIFSNITAMLEFLFIIIVQ